MKMEIRKKTMATLLIAILMISAFAVAIPVSAVEPFDSYEAAIIEAADRLVATQNNDGGWDWVPNENPDDVSPENTLGVTAQGVLDAYKLTLDSKYLDACLLTYTGAMVTKDGGWRIRGPDIPFLVELSEVTGVSDYADFAKGRYDAEIGKHTDAIGLAEFVRDGRNGQGLPGLISWDINLYVQGALALDRYFTGYFTDAEAMADVIYDALYVTTILYDPTVGEQEDYGLALSGALEAFMTTGTHETEASDLEAILLGIQVEAGYFQTWVYINDVQTTAYAVMALIKTDNLGACMDAGNYFLVNQLVNGEFVPEGEDENHEGTSEVIQALYDICIYEASHISTTATIRPPVISIFVSPTTIDFGTIISGRNSDPKTIDVTNNGEITVTVTADTDSAFYQSFLDLDGMYSGGWNLGSIPYGTFDSYTMQLIGPTTMGPHDAVLVFWAEAS